MGHHKHRRSKRCKYRPTDENQDKIIFPKEKIVFCEQIKAFPIGKRR